MTTDPACAGAIVCEDLGAATLSNTHSFAIRSNRLGRTLTVDVALPPHFPREGERLPIVFVLDGDATFGLAAQVAASLQFVGQLMPPALVVGVGYRSDLAQRSFGVHRSRDYTPSVDRRYLAMMRAAPEPYALPQDVLPGGADEFRAFLLEELTPILADRFGGNPDDRTIVGMSLGGLFVAHALVTAPESFQRYLAASPSIWWDDELVFRCEAALAERVTDLPVRVFLSAGAQEEAQDPVARIVSRLERLADTLSSRGYPGLRLTHRVFSDESHMSVFPAALSRGLVVLFDGSAEPPAWARIDSA